MIDENQAQARALVEQLHAAAARAGRSELRTLLEDAAVLLDEYQAGQTLATPHPWTGYELAPIAMRVAEFPVENITAQEIAA